MSQQTYTEMLADRVRWSVRTHLHREIVVGESFMQIWLPAEQIARVIQDQLPHGWTCIEEKCATNGCGECNDDLHHYGIISTDALYNRPFEDCMTHRWPHTVQIITFDAEREAFTATTSWLWPTGLSTPQYVLYAQMRDEGKFHDLALEVALGMGLAN